jgi:SAM-dependent methyltransferase
VTLRLASLQAAYSGAAGAWAAGPAGIYETMAAPLVADCPIPLAGAAVLDFGAGTGATSHAIERAGARVTAADLALGMLRADRAGRPPAVNADVLRLPFEAGSFDVAVGAFVISHVPEPADALREVARTVRDGGVVMTVGFDNRWVFPAKQAIEEVLLGFGMTLPDWYVGFKRDVEPLTAFPDRLAAVARAAGLVEVEVKERPVDVGVRTTDGIIAWRLGYPVSARFMVALDDERRAEVLEALRDAVGPDPQPLVPELLVLVARA